MGPYVIQNTESCSRVPTDLMMIQSKNKNKEKLDLCYSPNRSVITLGVTELIPLPSFEVSVLRIEYPSTRMMLKTHHIYVVSHVCASYVSTDNVSYPGPVPDL